MESRKRVLCPENEELAAFLLQKRNELADKPKGISENLDATISKAYNNVCCAKSGIKTLKELSQIKGVGKWILKLVQGFFDNGSGSSGLEDLNNKVRRAKGTKRYLPQRNSVAYALLITLYRGTTDGNEFMRKQELIDAAEASGLSRVPIVPEKAKGKVTQFGSSPRDWYTGWSCMKTLIAKGLVVKSSCPAKYMLTEEGKEAARECLMRSHLVDPRDSLAVAASSSDVEICGASNLEPACPELAREPTSSSIRFSRQDISIDVPLESLERFMRMGYSKEQILHAFTEVSETGQSKEISSVWPAVLSRLREDEGYDLHSGSQDLREDCRLVSCSNTSTSVQVVDSQSNRVDSTHNGRNMPRSSFTCSASGSFTLRACSSSSYGSPMKNSSSAGLEVNVNILSMPPLSFGERFDSTYDVILILDDREQFIIHGSKGCKLIESICKEHQIKIQVKRLPVGDGIWIARHKHQGTEYVLDFIVERKKVDDLRSSIRDNRYKDQKLRLLRCGLKKVIYLVEGDPNSSEASESIKTACFTTEILEGFDVQRASCLRDTLMKYGHLTRSITQYYRSQLPEEKLKCAGVCPTFPEFIKRCQDLDKITVSDVFAIQLMQVPQVTEEVAIAVLDLYPTLFSLVHAYSLLEEDVHAQADMLRKQSNNVVSAVASRNIYQLVWGNDQ